MPVPETGDTGIEGVITVGPTHGGPVRPGMPSSTPLANATFVVANESSAVAEFTTDNQGHFKVSLPPGHYTVTKKERQKGIGRYGPFDVDVVARDCESYEGYLNLHNFYVRYKLPLMVEVQHFEYTFSRQ